MRPIWAAKNRRQALGAVKAFADEWIVEEERAVVTLRRDLHECLSYLEFPEEDHTKIRTTNPLERSFREVRRRTRPMGVYANTASADRIMFGVTDEMNKRWRVAPSRCKVSKLTDVTLCSALGPHGPQKRGAMGTFAPDNDQKDCSRVTHPGPERSVQKRCSALQFMHPSAGDHPPRSRLLATQPPC